MYLPVSHPVVQALHTRSLVIVHSLVMYVPWTLVARFCAMQELQVLQVLGGSPSFLAF